MALAVALPGVIAGAQASESWTDSPFDVAPQTLLSVAKRLSSQSTDEDVQVLLADAVSTYDEAGRRSLRRRLVYCVLTPAGIENWSVTSVAYSPWHQSRPEVRARVLSRDGKSHDLDVKTLTDSPAANADRALFDDRRVLQGPLPGLEVGAIVIEESVVRDHRAFFDGGTVFRHPLAMYVPVHRGRLVLEAPKTLPLRYLVRLMPGLEPELEVGEDRFKVVFEYRDVPAFSAVEDGLPYHEPRFPQILVATGESWKELAGLYSSIVDEKIAVSDLATFRERIGPAPPGQGRPERVNQLLDAVRGEIRYTGLELGASSIIPYTPQETLERKFGDCKDQAALLTALLRADGMEAHLALLKTGLGRDVEPGLPGLGQFNHAIVYVAGSPPLWVDPTHPFVRAGELPIQAQNRLALVASTASSRLVRTPSSNSVDNRIVETRQVFLSDLGPGRVIETSEYSGAPERESRTFFSSLSREEAQQNLEQYVANAYLAAELVEFSYGDPHDLSRPFHIRLEARGADRAVVDLSEGVVAILIGNLLDRLPEVFTRHGEEREGEFVFAEPFSVEWRYRIMVPAGLKLRALPEDHRQILGSAVLSQEGRVDENGDVRFVLRFDSGHRRIGVQEFEGLRAGVEEFNQRDLVLVWFDQVGESLLAAGRISEAVTEQRRLVELEPSKAIHRVRLARALLAGGMGEAAKRQARRAVELEPATPTASWILGWTLQHDALGRRFGRGFDRQGSLAALRRARDLDPSDPVAQADLAILLEHDAEGIRYSDAVDLEAAIAEYRKLKALDEEGSFDVNLLVALFRAERFKALEEAAVQSSESVNRDIYQLIAMAVNSGAEAAAEHASRQFGEPDTRTQRLNSAAQQLLLVRRYSLAGDLLRLAAKSAANPAEVHAAATVLGKAERHEGLSLPPDDPVSVVKRYLIQLLGSKMEIEDLRPFLHPTTLEALAETGPEMKAAWSQVLERLSPLGPSNTSRKVVLDLALAAMETSVEGDDERGYRVRLGATVAGMRSETNVFVVPHEGEYRIVANAETPALVALEALRRLERDDRAGARQWLDWASPGSVLPKGEDPYGGAPFPLSWKVGDPVHPAAMRRAAAGLLVTGGLPEPALPILEEALRGAKSEDERRGLQVALATAYSKLDRGRDLLAVARDLLDREPTSQWAYAHVALALGKLERYDDLHKLAEKRLQADPQAPLALHTLAGLAAEKGDTKKAGELYRRLEELDSDNSMLYNEWAWMHLFREPPAEEGLALAERAARLSNYKSYPILHTLATFYADFNRPEDAYKVIVQALGLKPDPSPSPSDWYVLGRIAEAYGLDSDAQEIYQRALKERPKELASMSPLRLAEKRLAGLKKAGR